MDLTLIRLITLYRHETCPPKKTDELSMAVFQIKLLMKMNVAYYDAK